MSLVKACRQNAVLANTKNKLEEKGDLIYCLLFLLKKCTVVIIFLFGIHWTFWAYFFLYLVQPMYTSRNSLHLFFWSYYSYKYQLIGTEIEVKPFKIPVTVSAVKCSYKCSEKITAQIL